MYLLTKTYFIRKLIVFFSYRNLDGDGGNGGVSRKQSSNVQGNYADFVYCLILI